MCMAVTPLSLRDKLFAGIEKRRLTNNRASVVVLTRKETQVLAHSPIASGVNIGYAALTANKVGKGTVLYFNFLPGLMTNTIGVQSNSMYGEDALTVIDEKIVEYTTLVKNAVNWAIEGNRLVSLNKHVAGLLIYLKQDRAKKRYYLHLLATPKREIGVDGLAIKEYFPESTFDINAGTGELFGCPLKNPSAWQPSLNCVSIPKLELVISNKLKVTRATMIGFDFVGEKQLNIGKKQGFRYIDLPKGSVTKYSVITLE